MDNLQHLVNVSRMYYQRGMNQGEIADQLKVSRAKISLMLSEARQKGIVEIVIRNPLENNEDISNVISSMFGVVRCVVVPTSISQADSLIELTASRATEVFNEEAKSGDTIGIAWGRTCYSFMWNYQPRRQMQGMNIVPLIGGSNRNLKRYQLNEMVRLFAEKLEGTPVFIHAPALPGSPEDYELYMNSTSIKQMMDLWKRIDVAVVSVGAPPVSKEFDGSKIIAKRKRICNIDVIPVGDICARYFNIRGKFIEAEEYRFVIGMPVESLRMVKKIICVVAGIEKAYSLLAALKTGLINTLVTDEQTAMAVIRARKEEEDGSLKTSLEKLFGVRLAG